jgi:hypothetical protein
MFYNGAKKTTKPLGMTAVKTAPMKFTKPTGMTAVKTAPKKTTKPTFVG